MIDRNLAGAHYGLRDWIMQRITAVVMLVYSVLFLIMIICLPHSYQQWQCFFAQTWVRLVTQIFILALTLHAWVGIRDLWMDYIKPVGLRLFLHVATILWLVGCLIYSVQVIWGLA
ncbi:succinate dehydrogenase, hydrophobic membrane anchor protein [Snodgrassella alvi]|jgi:succinate dehydrogenase / fumarate reductase, membrane anchor subunit|uniref:succinate dehydrogenase, hydrophobic membrane anchor protein n=1 Tax=Snodgrassella alvi TaxID=1196083 RepID=UPI000C1EB273|nr:succinate dehydrogenase, hydrophobic membrane anchor protein [Snodgrassella alvi]PIT09990.1 succinate dehydrogenase, hydrophobic membrane anchor protein [Snodgrassella alvi]PIT30511.1 succinate dehydrogenase, hydrophobic membrane anchor protein [Snodgrassella alvi]PIT57344.1 succinate dehydrogenase, hydrophobic membrane anchor protein [Snodgrassella alvi]